ncbi:hypothetical protein CEXT_73531 [Caerostris extrusa]|uniref:Uncharacterized protein n=1 Tax=Caerostris extrusa TaxID=172846 RepID=A0AAV4MMY7_CAEEX|nr:hypothetical protein CEXT_73531 [Caerostris extrusa]
MVQFKPNISYFTIRQPHPPNLLQESYGVIEVICLSTTCHLCCPSALVRLPLEIFDIPLMGCINPERGYHSAVNQVVTSAAAIGVEIVQELRRPRSHSSVHFLSSVLPKLVRLPLEIFDIPLMGCINPEGDTIPQSIKLSPVQQRLEFKLSRVRLGIPVKWMQGKKRVYWFLFFSRNILMLLVVNQE